MSVGIVTLLVQPAYMVQGWEALTSQNATYQFKLLSYITPSSIVLTCMICIQWNQCVQWKPKYMGFTNANYGGKVQGRPKRVQRFSQSLAFCFYISWRQNRKSHRLENASLGTRKCNRPVSDGANLQSMVSCGHLGTCNKPHLTTV